MSGEITTHPLIKNRLISPDGHTALFSVALAASKADGAALLQTVAAIRTVTTSVLAPHDLSAIMTGMPVMRAEFATINLTERYALNAAGFLVGTLVCFLYFRRLSYALMAATLPAASIAMTYGLIGWLGVPLTVSLQIVAPLVTVNAFNNAMHLFFGILRNGTGPEHHMAPVSRALGQVGPASLMTSLTSAIAFCALMLTQSDVVQAFGGFAAFGAIAAFLAVMTLIPALATIGAGFRRRKPRRSGKPVGAGFAIACVRADARFARWPRMIVGVGGFLFVAFALAQTTLSPRYLLQDNVPLHSETRRAIAEIDSAFGGSQPLRVLVRFWPQSRSGCEHAE